MEAARVDRQVLWPHWPFGAARKSRVKRASVKQEPSLGLPKMVVSEKICRTVNMNIVCLGDSIGHERSMPR